MRLFFALFAALHFLAACGPRKETEKPGRLRGYDLQRPFVLKLPLELDEISGLAYVRKDKTLLAINDETGILFKIDVRQPRYIQQWRFGPPGDYEDVATADSLVYVLRSDGTLFEIHFKNKDTTVVRQFPFPQKGNEFESLHYLRQSHSLLLVCKACAADSKDEFSWYQFSLDSLQFEKQRVRFPVQKIEALLNYKGKRFKPSGAALHPKTGNLYIISAVNNAIVVITPKMEVAEAAHLSGPVWLQPEGIEFDGDGNMFISNETNKVQAANILIFPYRPTH